MVFILPLPEWILNSSFLSFIHPQMEAVNNFILGTGRYIAAGIFIVAASTDGVDGYIARKTNQVTQFGKFIDPIADKLLVTAALIALVQMSEVTGWAAMIIISREFVVTGLRVVAAGEGIVIAASNWGKIKTIVQIVAIVASLLPFPFIKSIQFDRYSMLLAVIVTFIRDMIILKRILSLLSTGNKKF
jgi:CDP-diacylglycerol--glycerol-3-phosphate 3-phosphatidyltransferase